MDEKKIVAALLTVACHTNLPKNAGNDYRDEVTHTYEYFLKRLAEEEAASIPDPLTRISHQHSGIGFEGAESGDCGLTLSR